jgi:hypothetical protein
MCKWSPYTSSSFTILFHLPIKFNPHFNCNIQQSAFYRLIFQSPPYSLPAKSYNFSVMTRVFVGFAFSIVRTCLQRGATTCSKRGYNFELTSLALSTCQIRTNAYAGRPMLCLLMIFALRMLLCLRWVIRNSTVLLHVMEISELLWRFDVLTVVLMKIQVFWEVTLCHWVSNSFWWKYKRGSCEIFRMWDGDTKHKFVKDLTTDVWKESKEWRRLCFVHTGPHRNIKWWWC